MKSFALLLLLLLLLTPLAGQKIHEICAPCHNSAAEDFLEHPHAGKDLSCDACHGKSDSHVQAAGNMPPDRVTGPLEQPALCGTCHPTQRKGFQASRHWKLIEARTRQRSPACTTCHGAHDLRSAESMEAQCKRCHESLPGACLAKPASSTAKVGCANCHDKHSLQRQPGPAR